MQRDPIAIVDDDPQMAGLICDMLEPDGLRIDVYNRASTLLRHARLPQYRTLIVDLSLPDMDGFDLLGQLCVRAPNSALVLISGHDLGTLEAAQLIAQDLGCTVKAILQKPFSHAALAQALELPHGD